MVCTACPTLYTGLLAQRSKVADMAKGMVNLQDSFLNQVRKDNTEIEMVLLDGTHLTGAVRGFDNFTVVVNAQGNQHLVYKHAVATVCLARGEGDYLAPSGE